MTKEPTMTYDEAVHAIKSNYPPAQYSMLREALDMAMVLLSEKAIETPAAALAEKLEAYEQQAYAAGFGGDWLTDIGEGFKFYVESCAEHAQQPTLTGFVAWIDEKAKEAGLATMEA